MWFINCIIKPIEHLITQALSWLKWIIKAETTATGKINLFWVVFAGIAGMFQDELFANRGFFLLGICILSAVIADRSHHA
jgi:hypothetical protein